MAIKVVFYWYNRIEGGEIRKFSKAKEMVFDGHPFSPAVPLSDVGTTCVWAICSEPVKKEILEQKFQELCEETGELPEDNMPLIEL